MADKDYPQKELPEEQPVQAQQRYAGPGSLRPTAPEKRSWPELVGLTTEEAERKIKEEMPNAKVQVIPPDHCVTFDFRLDRVRLFTDSSGKVAREPRLG